MSRRRRWRSRRKAQSARDRAPFFVAMYADPHLEVSDLRIPEAMQQPWANWDAAEVERELQAFDVLKAMPAELRAVILPSG